MANKAFNRNNVYKDQGVEAYRQNNPDKEKADRYFNEYAKRNYRTVGVKFNVHYEDEAKVLAYLDSRNGLKKYLMDLIQKDMEEHPEEVEKAYEEYKTILKLKKGNIDVKAGDILMVCDHCDYKTALRRKTYFLNDSRVVCPSCGEIMTAKNAPEIDDLTGDWSKELRKIRTGWNNEKTKEE